ncbi:hypothetical protein G3I77_02075 [Streptomyces sp. D2-8]|uniref:hypothetical protein n=1 Tax=Streptomyces sp. D2-8 TaxID=2707767 RepID=UPI0020BF8CA7|nr:hypothetical protein [Streptomyces sp. D2-8]MCK8431850.1 hypothetical protein [Streptomyces sp. D2-8]
MTDLARRYRRRVEATMFVMDFLTSSTAPWWFASVAALVGWAAGDWLRGRRDAKERKRVELNRAVTDFLGASARIMEARMNSDDELGGPGDQAALISARDSIRLVAGPAIKEAADNVMKATAVRWSEDLTKRGSGSCTSHATSSSRPLITR